jgi:hypothetical protein
MLCHYRNSIIIVFFPSLTVSLYRVFHLKSSPWILSCTKQNKWQYWILAAVSHCYRCGTAWNRYDHYSSYLVAQWVLVTEKHFCVLIFCYQLVYCLIQCFLIRKFIAKCFMNSSRWFCWKLMFENEHILLVNTLYSYLHNFCATSMSSGQTGSVTLNHIAQGRLGKFITQESTCFRFHFCTLVHDFCGWCSEMY